MFTSSVPIVELVFERKREKKYSAFQLFFDIKKVLN